MSYLNVVAEPEQLDEQDYVIEHRRPEDLIPNPQNFRRHPELQKQALDESIDEHGWLASVLLNRRTGRILDGHARVEYAIAHGLETVPCRVIDVDEKQERRILAIFDPISAMAKQDDTALAGLLKSILDDGDFIPTGYDDEEVRRLLESIGDESEASVEVETEAGKADAAEEIPEDIPARAQAGDIWALGRHRLLIGNIYDRENVDRLLGETIPDMVFADPPYGISLKPTWSKSKGAYEKIEGDTEAFDPGWFLPMADTIFFWGANYFADQLPPSSFWICWDKQGMDLHRDHADCEFAWCNLPKPARVVRHVWDGFRRDSEQGEKRVHAAQKPVKLLVDIFQWLEGETVFEPFAGSGSTLLACELTGRRCFTSDIDPKCADMVIARYEKLTGEAAILIERDVRITPGAPAEGNLPVDLD